MKVETFKRTEITETTVVNVSVAEIEHLIAKAVAKRIGCHHDDVSVEFDESTQCGGITGATVTRVQEEIDGVEG